MCTQTIANMVVINDRYMTNVHVVENRSPWSMNGSLHAIISSHMVRKRLIARDLDFRCRKLNDFQAKQ